jgi:pyruvate dehydrogenase phosphatase regulatory subunit
LEIVLKFKNIFFFYFLPRLADSATAERHELDPWHTGAPGYCLYVPSEYALHVYDRLMYVGRDYGAKDVGTLTQRFMRIERFIPFWAEELTSFVTPFEAGMGSYVHLKKNGDFIGKEVMLRQKTTNVHRRLCMFHQVEDFDAEKDI